MYCSPPRLTSRFSLAPLELPGPQLTHFDMPPIPIDLTRVFSVCLPLSVKPVSVYAVAASHGSTGIFPSFSNTFKPFRIVDFLKPKKAPSRSRTSSFVPMSDSDSVPPTLAICHPPTISKRFPCNDVGVCQSLHVVLCLCNRGDPVAANEVYPPGGIDFTRGKRDPRQIQVCTWKIHRETLRQRRRASSDDGC